MFFELSTSSRVHAVNFLPDHAEIACRAILPQCFRRADWAALCAIEPSVAAAHRDACRAAQDQAEPSDAESAQGR